jgi:hypothetical protein
MLGIQTLVFGHKWSIHAEGTIHFGVQGHQLAPQLLALCLGAISPAVKFDEEDGFFEIVESLVVVCIEQVELFVLLPL